MARKKELRSIKFNGGISRVDNSPVTRPYDLRNAVFARNGRIRKLGSPSTSETALTVSGKPYHEWNGFVVDRTNRDNDPAVSGATFEGIMSMDSAFNGLYASAKYSHTDGDFYRILRMYRDYDSDTDPDVNIFNDVSAITNVSYSLVDMDATYTNLASDTPVSNSDIYIHYLLIPYNDKGEAGKWRYFGVKSNLVEVGGAPADVFLPNFVELDLNTNDATKRVDIYRSTNQDQYGYTHLDGTSNELDEGLEKDVDHGMYMVASLSTVSKGSDPYNTGVVYLDNNVLLSTPQWTNFKSNNSLSDGLGRYELDYDGDAFTYISDGSYYPALIETRNYAAEGILPGGSGPEEFPRTIGAEVMYNDGGTMLYGNVYVPTTRINSSSYSTGSEDTVIMQYEYEDDNGDKYYGPTLTFLNLVTAKVAWHGESALLIFRDGDLWERIEPNASGWYISEYLIDDSRELQVTYHADSVQHVELESVSPYSITNYKQFPSSVLMSPAGRPGEISFNSFSTPDETEIRAIAPARQSEEEGLKSYSFYVFTDRTIQVYNRDDRDVRLVENLTTNLGIKVKEVTEFGDTYSYPLYISVKHGIVFVGSDNRLYLVSGRRYEEFDNEIPDAMTDIVDMAYNPQEERLYVLDGERSVWLFDFDRGGWMGRYEFEDDKRLIHLFYSDELTEVFAVVDFDEDTITVEFDEDGTDSEDRPDSRLVTQEFSSAGVETRMQQLEIDYDIASYDNTDSTTWVTVRHSIRNSDVMDWEEANGGVDISYKVGRSRLAYPTLLGRGHQLSVIGFDELRDLELILDKED